jgi:hypothetical protein
METFVSEFVYFSYLSSGKDELFQSEIQSDLDSLQKMYSNNPILECDMPFFESFGLKIPPDFFKDHKLFRNVKEKAPAGLSAFKIEFNTITGAIGFVEMEQQAESLDLTSKGDWIPILEAYKEKFGAKAYEVGGIYGKYRLVGKMKGFNVDLGGGINKLNIKVSYRDRLFDLNLKNKVTVRAMLNPFYGSQILTEKANQLISKIVEFNTTKFKRSAKKMIKVGESDLVL